MGLVRFTSESIVDEKKFFKEVEETRKKGYAIDDEEYMLGVKAIAAPIQTSSSPQAAIWVVGFTPGFNEQKMGKVTFEIRHTAQEINLSLKDHVM